MDILERISHWARVAPGHPAHKSAGRSLSYGELARRSDSLAAYIRHSLPDDQSPIVIVGHKEPELLIAFLGAAKAGHPYVPVESAVPRQRVEQIVETAGAVLTLTPERVSELSLGSGSVERREPDPSAPYYIMFTSGSTGTPKGVVITLGCLTHFLSWMLSEQTFVEQRETFLNQVPYSFDVSMMDTYTALTTGGTVVSIGSDSIADLRKLYSTLASSGVTVWVSTPSFARMCLVEPGFSAGMMPQMRKFLFCGETLAPEVAAQLLERFPEAEVWNTYGPTEATVATTSVRIDRALLARYPSLPIGYPMPGTQMPVVDQARNVVAEGERGEIIIAGPNVSPGYLNRPDLTERAFFDWHGQRAYHTGDWGRYCDGMLFCEGRMDNQIKLHGHRIELGDVEANLCALPGVQDAVVIPVTKQGQVDSLAAFVILSERGQGSDFEVSNALRLKLSQRVPPYMLPRRICLVGSFPMNVNGKADRRKLAESLSWSGPTA
jgi:D-alanine--poly(phosphoribitol) ligase subunit 1